MTEEQPAPRSGRLSLAARRKDSIANTELSGDGPWVNCGFKFLHYLGIALTPIAITVAALFRIPHYAIAVSSALAIVTVNIFVVDFILFYYKKTRNWPKLFDLLFLQCFLICTILVWIPSPMLQGFVSVNLLTLIFGYVAVAISVLWIFGKPAFHAYVADIMDPVAVTHPLTRHFIRVLTGVFLAIMWVSFIFLFPTFVYFHKEMYTEAVMYHGYASIVNIVLVIAYFAIFMPCYQKYFMKNMEKIGLKYEAEIIQWMEKHPEHDMTKKTMAHYADAAQETEGNVGEDMEVDI